MPQTRATSKHEAQHKALQPLHQAVEYLCAIVDTIKANQSQVHSNCTRFQDYQRTHHQADDVGPREMEWCDYNNDWVYRKSGETPEAVRYALDVFWDMVSQIRDEHGDRLRADPELRDKLDRLTVDLAGEQSRIAAFDADVNSDFDD